MQISSVPVLPSDIVARAPSPVGVSFTVQSAPVAKTLDTTYTVPALRMAVLSFCHARIAWNDGSGTTARHAYVKLTCTKSGGAELDLFGLNVGESVAASAYDEVSAYPSIYLSAGDALKSYYFVEAGGDYYLLTLNCLLTEFDAA